MTTNDALNQPHPEELLEAYALDVLEEVETLQVESHLEGCDRCSLAVAELHRSLSLLGHSVAQRQPSAALQFRVMQALEPAGVQAEPTVRRAIWRAYRTPVARFLLPTAAGIMIALFSLGVVMNFGLSDRTKELERETATLTAQVNQSNATLTAQVAQSNATLAAQVTQSTEEDSRLAETVQQLRSTSYWLANPDIEQLVLKPANGAGASRGTILVSSDGRRALLLLADMKERSPTSTYHVWLTRPGDQLWAGKVNVDEAGWGTATIQPKESFFRFDKVELTADTVPGAATDETEMVLEGEIPALRRSQMLVHQQRPWR